ncbi:MAG: NupC/NupG family nucleoside CNT transporter [Planctomycetaceae bacterium]
MLEPQRWQGLIGIVVLLGLAVLMSEHRSRIRWSVVAWGLSLQFLFALLILRTPIGAPLFNSLNDGINRLIGYSNDGTTFVFKPLNDRFQSTFEVSSTTTTTAQDSHDAEDSNDPSSASPLPVGTRLVVQSRDGPHVAPQLMTIAFWVLPTVIFFSALLALLYHLGVMQWLVKGIAWAMIRTMGTSGAETLCVAANIFVGQTEAPLMVRPFLKTMTRSELLTVMIGGFATIAGGVLALYVLFLQRELPNIAGHLMAASVMSAPAALVIAKLMLPETETPDTLGTLHIEIPRTAANAVEAFGDGVTQGLQLALNIGAMLLAFVAMVALVNGLLGLIPVSPGADPWSLQGLLGQLFRPLAWTLGVNWHEAHTLGMLMGEKIVLTELIAYSDLSQLEVGTEIQERTALIASYALCGFANFASIGIQLGGIGAMAPERKPVIAALAVRAMLGGALASWLTAAVAGLLL